VSDSGSDYDSDCDCASDYAKILFCCFAATSLGRACHNAPPRQRLALALALALVLALAPVVMRLSSFVFRLSSPVLREVLLCVRLNLHFAARPCPALK